MVTRSRIVVLVILIAIVLLTAWSRLHYIDESDHEPQRVRLEDHPAFQTKPTDSG